MGYSWIGPFVRFGIWLKSKILDSQHEKREQSKAPAEFLEMMAKHQAEDMSEAERRGMVFSEYKRMRNNEATIRDAMKQNLTLEQYVEKYRSGYNRRWPNHPENNPWTPEKLEELKRHASGVETYLPN